MPKINATSIFYGRILAQAKRIREERLDDLLVAVKFKLKKAEKKPKKTASADDLELIISSFRSSQRLERTASEAIELHDEL